eukprot:6204865-Pleurochrysis_carterae.AAC.1
MASTCGKYRPVNPLSRPQPSTAADASTSMPHGPLTTSRSWAPTTLPFTCIDDSTPAPRAFATYLLSPQTRHRLSRRPVTPGVKHVSRPTLRASRTTAIATKRLIPDA